MQYSVCLSVLCYHQCSVQSAIFHLLHQLYHFYDLSLRYFFSKYGLNLTRGSNDIAFKLEEPDVYMAHILAAYDLLQ